MTKYKLTWTRKQFPLRLVNGEVIKKHFSGAIQASASQQTDSAGVEIIILRLEQ